VLTGEKVALRARRREDLEPFAQFLDDVDSHLRAGRGPWLPRSLQQRQAAYDHRAAGEPDPATALFTVVEPDDEGTVLGAASLWQIDTHNRTAHLGISLLPAAQGRGLGTAVLRLLCDYGFRVLGLGRLQIDTLPDNTPMLRAAAACGFVPEARLRQAVWTGDGFTDEVLLGLLAEEWRRGQANAASSAAKSASGTGAS
jgi:RimJ/RimL family protein N-acetyltransferase